MSELMPPNAVAVLKALEAGNDLTTEEVARKAGISIDDAHVALFWCAGAGLIDGIPDEDQVYQ